MVSPNSATALELTLVGTQAPAIYSIVGLTGILYSESLNVSVPYAEYFMPFCALDVFEDGASLYEVIGRWNIR